MKPQTPVEIILSGGLGNQLFQYAFGKWLSVKEGRDLVLNTYRLGMTKAQETPRSFALREMKLKASVIHKERLLGKNRYLDHVLKRMPFGNYSHEDQNLAARYFWGHWLRMDFADAIREELLGEFTYAGEISLFDKSFFTEVQQKKVLSIHVRRGDYVSNPRALAFHGLLDDTYYNSAIKKAHSLSTFDEVWCFTDDPHWCKQNFSNIRVIKLENKNPFLDLFLMSKCSGNIISNSTFSWWAAWLNANPEKLVMIPENWFRKQGNPEIYPQKWQKVRNL